MRLRVALLLTLGLLPAFAQEAPPAAVLNQFPLKSYSVAVEVTDALATVVVGETFYNSGRGLAEADFFFPLPPASAASGLQLLMNGRFYGGNLLTRKRAGRIYDEITRRQRDPALLDCVGKDLYRCRVFPIPANGTASVKFSYRHPLEAAGPMRRLVVPLDAARFHKRPVGEFSLSIHLETEAGLQAITCPTHDVSIRRVSAHEAFVDLRAKNAVLARDLVLLFAVDDAPVGAVVSSYRRVGQAGYFLLSLDAAFARERAKTAPRDVVLAVDTSNSSGRDGIDAAAAAVAEAVSTLRPEDRFALLAFSMETSVLSGFQHPADDTRDQIRALYSEHPVLGRTRLGAAIREATDAAAQGRPGAGVIVLTDGRETEESGAAEAARAAVVRGHRVGLCGVGTRVDTVHLDRLGEHGRGDSAYAWHGAKLADGVRHLLETTRAAPLTDIEITVDGATEIYPEQQRILRPGDTLLIAGRYWRAGVTKVRVECKVAGEPVTRTLLVDLRARGGDPAVARMWAARRVGTLLDQARGRHDPGYHKKEIRRLGRQFGIVTPHTSLLVLEQGDQRRFLNGMRRRPLLQSDGGELLDRRTYTHAISTTELAGRIKKLRNCRNGAVNPFEDLLGTNRLRVRSVGDRTFYRLRDGVWVESELVSKPPAEPREVKFLSEEWRQLAASDPEIASALALGKAVLLRLADGSTVRVAE